MEAHSQELKEDYARLVARVAELEAKNRHDDEADTKCRELLMEENDALRIVIGTAVRNAKPHTTADSPRWAAVMDTFAVGSTRAKEMCRSHGLDPDMIVAGIYCKSCNE